MPTQLTALSVTKSYNDNLVLDGVTCAISAGERVGLVGENGSGKSTLLRLFAGLEHPDDGKLIVEAEGGLGYLPQDAPLPPEQTIAEVIDDALADLRTIEARLRQLEPVLGEADELTLAEYGILATAFELRGGYDADARVQQAMHGLGLAGIGVDRRVGSLSGGERVRLCLAAVLAASPEVLLLDEPTNHLDDAALTWLEDHLRTRRGTTVAVSHDRVFLERVVTSLIEVDVDRHGLKRYGDGYAGYVAEHAAARRRWEQAHERWKDEVGRLEETAATTARRVAVGRSMKDNNKMGYDRHAGRVQDSVSSRVRNAEQRLRRLRESPVAQPPKPLRFATALTAGQRARGGGRLLDAVEVSVEGRLSRVDLAVRAGERLLVSGPNGSGKSTLLRVLCGELVSDSGSVTLRGRAAYLAQDSVIDHPEDTVFASFVRGRGGAPHAHVKSLMSLGLFSRERLMVPVGQLSTGQRQRLALARALCDNADILLLDEPTNHLSLALIEEVEAAWEVFEGALVVASHDRRLRERWTGEHLVLPAEPLSAESGPEDDMSRIDETSWE